MHKHNFIFCFFAALAMSGCGSHNQGEHSEEEEHEHEHNHGDEIVLHAEDAEKFGVKTLTIQPDTFFEVLTVAGQVMNSPTQTATIVAPKTGTVNLGANAVPGNKVSRGQSIATISSAGISGGDASAAAKARINAAKREVDRLTPLLADGIVTKSEVNAARAEYEQALAAYSPAAAGGAAVSPIAGIITAMNVRNGEFVSAGQPIADVSASTELTIKVDVPTTAHNLVSHLTGANIRPAGSKEWFALKELGGRVKGETNSAFSSGYESVYLQLGNNGSIVPGTFAEIVLMGTPRPGVISVPVGAISEQQGTKFVFVRVDEDGYEKIPVVAGASNGLQVEILSGLAPGMEIVSEGAVFVRLAETSGNVPEGHSHNH